MATRLSLPSVPMSEMRKPCREQNSLIVVMGVTLVSSTLGESQKSRGNRSVLPKAICAPPLAEVLRLEGEALRTRPKLPPGDT